MPPNYIFKVNNKDTKTTRKACQIPIDRSKVLLLSRGTPLRMKKPGQLYPFNTWCPVKGHRYLNLQLIAAGLFKYA